MVFLFSISLTVVIYSGPQIAEKKQEAFKGAETAAEKTVLDQVGTTNHIGRL